jgi:hypothetical protein
MSIENSQLWIPVRYQISAEINHMYIKNVSPYHIQIILVLLIYTGQKQLSFPPNTARTEHGTCFGGSVRGIPKIAPSHWTPQWWTWDSPSHPGFAKSGDSQPTISGTCPWAMNFHRFPYVCWRRSTVKKIFIHKQCSLQTETSCDPTNMLSTGNQKRSF